ncbi:MAG: tetratricopeptide repeat protein [Gammaproteobacteria bacterium]|uniref:Tetratricopeptide repeat protein n=1 Tax=Candidatus Thiopontia autotrophica TaxID=2841688 RepID=A0A8J6TXE2_9GAMM|nr:tetratricopeptide repeat protein [Candidatus Thiopontia autotrophica]
MQAKVSLVLRLVFVIMVATVLSSCATTIKSQKKSAKVAQLQLELGVAYMEQGYMDMALVNLEKAQSIKPDDPEIQYALALLYLKKGSEERAEQHFMRAMREDKPYPEAQNGYGVLLCRQGRHREAAIYFGMAINNPDYKTPDVATRNSEICGDEMK